MSIGHFLGGVAGLIWDPATATYLLLRRSAGRDFQAGAWECVTGRVDQGESFEQALHREIGEETGLQVEIESIIATTHFFRGAPVPENELLGVIFSCIPKTPMHLKIESEHSEFRWMGVEEINVLLPDGNWLKKAIKRAEIQRKLMPHELRKFFMENGYAIEGER